MDVWGVVSVMEVCVVSERNKNNGSGIEIVSAEGTLVGFFGPFPNAAAVVDVLARQLLDEFVLLEALHADRAHFRALSHDQSFHASPMRLALAHHHQARQ